MTTIAAALEIARKVEAQTQKSWGVETKDPALPLAEAAVAIRNIAHHAWRGPPTVRWAFGEIERLAVKALQAWADGVGEAERPSPSPDAAKGEA